MKKEDETINVTVKMGTIVPGMRGAMISVTCIVELNGDENMIEFTKHFYDQCANITGGKENWFVIHLHFWSSIDFK